MNYSPEAAVLRSQGHRLTPQRLMVLEVIKESRSHLTADEIHASVQSQHPFVNIATIYRTLQWLQEVGIVSPIIIGGEPLRYEYVQGSPHHHLICKECGHQQEIDDEMLDVLKTRLLERFGFLAQLNHLGLTGLCAACRSDVALSGY